MREREGAREGERERERGREGGRERERGREGEREREGEGGRREDELQVNIPSRSVFNADHHVPTAHLIPHFVS